MTGHRRIPEIEADLTVARETAHRLEIELKAAETDACPVKVGDIVVADRGHGRCRTREEAKVTRVEPWSHGPSLHGVFRKQNGEWGSRVFYLSRWEVIEHG